MLWIKEVSTMLRNTMKYAILSFAVAALLALVVALLPGTATRASADNAPPGCFKDRGTIYCITTQNVGNAPDHSNSQQTTTTTSKKGSVSSSHPEVQQCVGPPGQCRK
jgi:hypothetical protein